MIKHWLAIATLVASLPLTAAVGAAQAQRLTLQEVSEMLDRKEPEEAVINRIREAKRKFDVSELERTGLIAKGATEAILRYLANPELPYTPPLPRAVSAGNQPAPDPVNYATDAYAGQVPLGVGLYPLVRGTLSPVINSSSLYLVEKDKRGILGRVPGLGGKTPFGVLPGVGALVRVSAGSTVFYLRLPEAYKIDDVTLVALAIDAKERRRELEFAPPKEKGAKPTLIATAIQQLEKVAVGARLYRLTTSTLPTGEFMLYVVGTADPTTGIQGKGYDFGVN